VYWRQHEPGDLDCPIEDPALDGPAVGRAWLADHPADDEEPAIWPWLGEVGFREFGGPSILSLRGWRLEVCGGTGGTSLWLNNMPICDDPTRGDIRRLAKVIDAELKEPKP
jgi:hypothetical protein